MKTLKNRRQWLAWKREEMSFQEDIAEPRTFPCVAYTTVRSFSYEEYRENYLYLEDLERLRNSLMGETPEVPEDPGCSCPECCEAAKKSKPAIIECPDDCGGCACHTMRMPPCSHCTESHGLAEET